jgi:DNA invertase Pin-like site-specific DNA recombinase
MTRAEKGQYVIELYKQGRTVREIAKLMHMSFGEIGKILKKIQEGSRNRKRT